MKIPQQKIAFVGLSHLGLVTSISWASLGINILAVDNNKHLVDELKKGGLRLREGGFELYEPGLEELFKQAQGRYHLTEDFSQLKDIDLVFFSQDTPTDGSLSLKKLHSLINQALSFFKPKLTIVLMSQVLIGFCRSLEDRIKKKKPDFPFNLYHWVDTIVMTTAIERVLKPERIIIGSANPQNPFPKNLQSVFKLFKCPVFHMSYESAELTKAAINLYLANSIAFANTISDFCEAVGASINEVIPALASDKRIGPFAYLRPSLRIAGGHLERDLSMFKRTAKKCRISSGVVSSILGMNARRYRWAIDKLNSLVFKKIKNPYVCIWGLSYKKNTTSMHNAASIKILECLSGKCRLTGYDPMAILPQKIKGFKRYGDKYEAVKGTDCVLILTEWDEFKNVDLKLIHKAMKRPIIIDSVGILHCYKKSMENFTYVAMGVGTKSN